MIRPGVRDYLAYGLLFSGPRALFASYLSSSCNCQPAKLSQRAMEGSKAKPDTLTTSEVDDGEETTLMLSESPSVHKPRNSTRHAALSSRSTNGKVTKHRSQLRCTNLLILSSAAAPLVVLIWWIVDAIQHRSDMLAASVIGGRLSYFQAKAIDFVCGALFAPLLMVLLDYLWFTNARVSVVNEQQKDPGWPLPTLVEASITSAGGFDLLKLRALLRGRTWRLSLLSLLVLLSGFAGKMLSNLIAYRAFTTNVPDSQQVTLRLMSDAYIDSPQFDELSIGGSGGLSQTQFSASQQADIANQMAALFTGLNFKSAIAKLDAGPAYIGTNATTASLNALNQTVVGLTSVPGYRLSVDCQPVQTTEFGALQMGETYFQFTVIPDKCTAAADPSCGTLHYAALPGMMSIGSDSSNNDDYQYVAFRLDNMNVFLGYLSSFNDTKYAINSSFGEVYPTAFNMTPFGFQSTKAIMTTWGVSCSIMRQEGFLNYTRQPGQSWTIAGSLFSDKKSVAKTFLSNWQTALNYQAPMSTISGIGPPLARTAGSLGDSMLIADGVTNEGLTPLNWTIFALNYLYASGEAQRISYEVAAENSSSNQPDYFYNVSATTTIQHYQITYIPLLLLLGLLSVLGAAVITGAMAFYTRNTRSTQVARDVNVLRLLVDSVAGLQESAPTMAAAGTLDKADLEKWAAGFRVRYSEVVEGDDIVIRLFRSRISEIVEGK